MSLNAKHTLRFTEEEKASLKKLAAATGITFPAYMRAVYRQHIKTPLKLFERPSK